GGRPDKGGRQRDTPGGLATYRIAVGRRHQVAPRQIVGALANEGGLQRGDFGRIDIRADHSLVELPANLSPQVLDALRSTRISGKLIELQADRGGRAERREWAPKKKYRD
ncbi:MAG: DbpA RNA binding domain-containing protein, partial [Actinomycetes bacterium]